MSRRLTPPPRVEARAAASLSGPKGGIGWKTIAAFLVLGALAVSVFAFLPSWVTPASPRPSTAADPSTLPVNEAEAAEAAAPEPGPLKPSPSPPTPTPSATPAPRPATQPEAPRAAPDPNDAAFKSAMSEGMAALSGQDYEEAKSAFERATSLRPGALEARDALSQAEERLRLAAIAFHRERGTALETREDWRRAESEYDQALALEATLQFAREGKARTERRAVLSEALASHLARPERLSDAAVLAEATDLLRRARNLDVSPGPTHIEQVRQLEGLVDAYSTAVVAELRSDGLTDVTVYRVGRLGAFESRAIELRPGRYTVIGSRDGYRDVRREIVVEPGKAPAPLVVLCEEPIR